MPHRKYLGEDATEYLNELANEMVLRHSFLSTQDFEELAELTELQNIADQRNARIIVAVGAGASAPVAYRSQELIDSLRQMPGFNRRRHERAIDRANFDIGLPEDDFEMQLDAMTKTAEQREDVCSQISRIYSTRHPTLLVYELLAHLMRHRFIDAIINFNWDELLDQSIEDEMGHGEYIEIISDRDCRASIQIDPSNQLYVPLHLKLHGTASDPETMRFTREAYFNIPERIRTTLRNLVGTQRCIVICVGYGLSDADFSEILTQPVELRVFNLSANPLSPESISKVQSKRNTGVKQVTSFCDVCPDYSSLGGPETPDGRRLMQYSCDYLLDALVDAIHERADSGPFEHVHLRSANRHRLLSQMMAWEASLNADGDAYVHYLRDRCVIEILFASVRGCGLLSVASLVQDRCGHYFDQYHLLCERNGGTPETWAKLCSVAGLIPQRRGNETYCARDYLDGAARATGLSANTLDSVFHEELRVFDVKAIAEALPGMVTPQTRLRLQPRTARGSDVLAECHVGIEATLEELQAFSEVEIHTQDDRICSRLFTEPRRITTFTTFNALTKHMVDAACASDEPVRLAICAETGQWLLGYLDQLREQKNITIDLIVAFLDLRQALEKALGDRLKIMQLPWYRHNRHITVYCENDKPVMGIYFVRRLRSAFINPVWISIKDAPALYRSFAELATEAAIRNLSELLWNERMQQLSDGQKEALSTAPETPKGVDEYRRRLLGVNLHPVKGRAIDRIEKSEQRAEDD